MKDETSDAVRSWRAKAQSDWRTVEILLQNQESPSDAICFHCQQFVEKLLKALLTRQSVEAPRTHDLRRLIQLAVPFAPELSTMADRADSLTVYGVETRYPGEWTEIDADEVQVAVGLAREFSAVLARRLET